MITFKRTAADRKGGFTLGELERAIEAARMAGLGESSTVKAQMSIKGRILGVEVAAE